MILAPKFKHIINFQKSIILQWFHDIFQNFLLEKLGMILAGALGKLRTAAAAEDEGRISRAGVWPWFEPRLSEEGKTAWVTTPRSTPGLTNSGFWPRFIQGSSARMPFSVGTVMGSTPWAATVRTSPLLLTAAVLGTVLPTVSARVLLLLPQKEFSCKFQSSLIWMPLVVLWAN